jgi:hypothetical protein
VRELHAEAIMNTREASAIAEVLNHIENGPGQGWRALLADRGEDGGLDGKGTDLRFADFRLWLETWITPNLKAVVGRYYKPRRRRGSLGLPERAKSGERLRLTLREGEAKEARGVEEAPYWVGYYKSIASQAIDRVEELERALAMATGVRGRS